MCVDAVEAVPRDRPDAPSTAADASFLGRDLFCKLVCHSQACPSRTWTVTSDDGLMHYLRRRSCFGRGSLACPSWTVTSDDGLMHYLHRRSYLIVTCCAA